MEVRRGGCRASLEKGAGEGQKSTHGRSPKKTTVGRQDDLQWVVDAIYRRSFSCPAGGISE